MKLYQYLLSAAVVATVATGAMAAHTKHHRRSSTNLFAGLNPHAKVQTIAQRAASFYDQHGFVNAVNAYENHQNRYFNPDKNTFVIMYDSSGNVLAHPDGRMRWRNVYDVPFVQTALNACWWGNQTDLTFNWNGKNVIAHAVPVARGNYCVMAGTVA